MRKARSWTKEKSTVPERCKWKLKEDNNIANTISACFYCELIKSSTSTGQGFQQTPTGSLQNNFFSTLLRNSFSEEYIHFKTNLK